MANDTLSITDNRTGQTYEVPIRYGTYPTYGAIHSTLWTCARSSVVGRGLRASHPRSGLHQHRLVSRAPSRFVDGERGILRYRGYPIEQLAEQGELPRDRLPPALRRAPRTQGAARRSWSRTSPSTRSSTRTSRSSWRASTTTPIPWASWWEPSVRSRPSIRTPRTSSTSRLAAEADLAADRQDADARSLRLSDTAAAPLRLSGQRSLISPETS